MTGKCFTGLIDKLLNVDDYLYNYPEESTHHNKHGRECGHCCIHGGEWSSASQTKRRSLIVYT